MRIVVTGVTGNVGTSVLPALGSDPTVDSVLGLARRLPERSWPKTEFAAVDIADPEADLVGLLRGADAVIHLAWAIQPARDERAMWRTNVEGTAALLRAAAGAGVGAVVPVPSALLRAVASLSWRLRLQPTDPGWVDLVLGVPLMDTDRIRRELEWEPRYDAADAVTDILDGFREGSGMETAPLTPVG
jgi:nucleoside-diphosphate-sugar epimerase